MKQILEAFLKIFQALTLGGVIRVFFEIPQPVLTVLPIATVPV
jgi:hypothetical protein